MHRFFIALGFVLVVAALAVLGLINNPLWGAGMMAAAFLFFLIGGFMWEDEQISLGYYPR